VGQLRFRRRVGYRSSPFFDPVTPLWWRSAKGHSVTLLVYQQAQEADMGRIIVANRHGHQVVEWNPTADTEESRAAIAEAEQILREARAAGCAISKKVDGVHVLDRDTFDPNAEEYQVLAPIAGG
jgi:hypothetical protein